MPIWDDVTSMFKGWVETSFTFPWTVHFQTVGMSWKQKGCCHWKKFLLPTDMFPSIEGSILMETAVWPCSWGPHAPKSGKSTRFGILMLLVDLRWSLRSATTLLNENPNWLQHGVCPQDFFVCSTEGWPTPPWNASWPQTMPRYCNGYFVLWTLRSVIGQS